MSKMTKSIISKRADNKIKVWLDDERTAPDGWIHVFWPQEVIELLKTNNVVELSLDHDLGDDIRGTGYDVILWLEEMVALHNFIPPFIRVHSNNASARQKMESGIKSIYRLYDMQKKISKCQFQISKRSDFTINDAGFGNMIYNYADDVSFKPSPIHGIGVFTKNKIESEKEIGLIAKKTGNEEIPDKNWERTKFGRYTNHSDDPNIKLIRTDDEIFAISKKEISENEELLCDYGEFSKLIREQNSKDFEEREHDWSEVLIDKEEKLTRGQIRDYYNRVKSKMFPFVKDRKVIIYIGIGKNQNVLKRNENNKPIIIKSISGDTPSDLDYWIKRRMIEIHPTVEAQDDIIWVDLDLHGNYPFSDAKKYADKVAKKMNDEFGGSIEKWFSGSTGIHVVGYLKEKVNIDDARSKLRDMCDELAEEEDKVTTGIVKGDGLRLDVTTLKRTGSIRAPYSLALKTGKEKKKLGSEKIASISKRSGVCNPDEISKTNALREKTSHFVPGKTNAPMPLAPNFDYIGGTFYHGVPGAGYDSVSEYRKKAKPPVEVWRDKGKKRSPKRKSNPNKKKKGMRPPKITKSDLLKDVVLVAVANELDKEGLCIEAMEVDAILNRG